MHLDAAREIKNELVRFARSWVRGHAAPAPDEPPFAIAVGLTVGGPTYSVAVRTCGTTPFAEAVVGRGQELAGDAHEVRDVGRIRPLQLEAADLQQRQRPLRPGLSIAHTDVTAGTLGAFVTP